MKEHIEELTSYYYKKVSSWPKAYDLALKQIQAEQMQRISKDLQGIHYEINKKNRKDARG